MPGGNFEFPQNSIFISKILEAIVPERIRNWDGNLVVKQTGC